MSRKVNLTVPVEFTVRDRDMKVLAVIDELSRRQRSCGRPIPVSLKALSDELGMSLATVRRAVSSCVKGRMLTVEENHLSNGGQMENGYALTEHGRSLVSSARVAGIV